MKVKLLLLALFVSFFSSGQVNINLASTNYTQNFNTLTSGTWTDNSTMAGWYARTDATASITTYAANTGGTVTAGLYAFGVAGTNPLTDRALGYGVTNAYFGTSGTGKGYIGWRLKNNTGSNITSINVTWTGEQWRRDNANAQQFSLSYQTGSTVTALNTGVWTNASSTFTSPQLSATAIALDGNANANRAANITVVITVSIPAGEEIMLRWEDLNDAGNDHLLAIDDVTVNATTAPTCTDPGLAFSVSTVTKNDTDANFTNPLATPITSAGAITYSSSNTAVATVDSITGEVDVVGVGTATITASQLANGTYCADIATYSLTVNSLTPTITLAAGSITAMSSTYGTESTNQCFTFTGSNLTGSSVTVTVPSGFEVATSSGGIYANSQTFTVTSGNASGTVCVRLANNTPAGTYSGNVSLTDGTTSATRAIPSSTVNPKPLTISGLFGVDKIYDGLTTATLTGTATLNGVVFADDVTISGTPTSNFVDKNVGTGKAITITGYTLGGTKAANYSVSQPTGVTANITEKPLSVTAPTIASKVYNGSAVSGAVSVGTITGFVGIETVTATATGVYADANAGTGKSATVTYVLANGTNGGLATNYSLAVGTGTGDITQATPVFTTSAIAVSVGGTYTLPGANVTSTSPGALTYSITSGGFATLTGTTITGVSVGSETVTVTQAASTNYFGGSTTVGVSVTNISYPLNSFLSTTGTGVYTNTTSVWSKCGNVGGCTGTTPGSGGWDAIGASGQAPIAGSTAYIQGNITGGTTGITNLTILSGGTLTTSGNYPISGSLVVKTGGILNVNSNLNFNNTSATFGIESNGIVVLNNSYANPNSSIWNGVEDFDPESIVKITNWNDTQLLFTFTTGIPSITPKISTGYTAFFGNLIIDTTLGNNWTVLPPSNNYNITHNDLTIINNNNVATGQNTTLYSGNSNTMEVGRDFIVNTPLASNIQYQSGTGSPIFNIKRNLIKYGTGTGEFRFFAGTTTKGTINVNGNILISEGIFNLQGTTATSGSTYEANLKGNLTANTNAILRNGNTNASSYPNSFFNFTGSTGIQTIDVASTGTNENNYINFNVKSGAIVQLINRDFELGTNSRLTVETGGTFDFGFNGTTALNLMNIGTGQVFTAQSGSTVKLTSPFGITTTAASPTSGNVQIPVASRIFDVGATYHYIGKANQVSGNALPLGITGKVIVELDTDALVFNATGNRTIATAGTLEIIRGIVEDTSANSFGNLASNTGNLTMSGGRYRIFKASTQPDLSGTYNLTAGVIEFAGPLNKTIRSPKSYQNIEVTGTDVGNSSGNITLNSAGTFTVKTGGVFTINDNSIVGPTGTQTVTVENGAIFKTGDVDGFNGSTLTSIQPTIESIILANGSTVEYSRATTTGDQTITLFSPAYRNLTISGTGVKTLQNDTATRVEEDLRIDSAKLLLTINQILTVKEGVSIAAIGAEFELDNNAQLIQIDEVDTNVGNNFKLKRLAFVHAQDYVYWSSPVFGFDVGLIPTQQRYFWNPINDNTNGTLGNWNVATGTDAIMPVGKGYIVNSGSGFPNRPLPAGNLETNFAGRPNNGTLTSTIQRGTNGASIDDNWNLVGNPYPSAIFAEEFLDANNTKINGSVWVWTHGQAPDNAIDPYYDNFGANYYATDYLKYNKLGATDTTFNGIIASGQGFMVNMLHETPSTTESVTFTNAMRTDATATPYNNAGFYRTANINLTVANPEEKHRIWLSIINTAVGQKESALLGYSANSTLAVDHFYDCIYVPRTEVGIYTLVNTGEYVIQGRPLPFLDSDLVPMGVKIVTAGSHKIAIKKVDGLFEGNQGIYLEDTVLGIVHDLKAAPYTFTSEVGVFNSRFIIRYTPSALSNDDFDSLDNNVVVSTQSTDVSIKSTNELMSSVLVYDILGRELVRKNDINANDITLPNVSVVNQALIVKITLENGQVVTRKIIL